MRKMLGNRKALSPVVAAIILIAVTVAVSIAVAAWMGALTIGFMGGTEELKIIDAKFETAGIVVEVANVGTGKVTINDVRVDGTSQTSATYISDFTTDGVLDKGKSGKIETGFTTWTPGVKYTITLVTASGNQFIYTAVAPS